MTAHRLRALCTSAAALLVGAALVTPAAARPDPGPPPQQQETSTSCPLSRVGTQFVRCDNLTGDGAAAPAWVAQL
jgi:hypothetical protein